ncbi:ribonuclease H, partial [Sesbania bispinosa]
MYDHLLQHVQRRLSMWKGEALSFAGRITLSQTVLVALPCYTIQSTLLPKGICARIERHCREFIWGDKPSKRVWHTVPWDDFSLPKNMGGWGFKDLYSFNKAMLMKLSWGLIHKPEELWVQILR